MSDDYVVIVSPLRRKGSSISISLFDDIFLIFRKLLKISKLIKSSENSVFSIISLLFLKNENMSAVLSNYFYVILCCWSALPEPMFTCCFYPRVTCFAS